MSTLQSHSAFNGVKPKLTYDGRVLSPKFRKPTQKSRKAPKFLTENQVEELLREAYKNKNRFYRKRNALMIMMCFRHGLRRNELLYLEWSQINLNDAQLTIHRLKNGKLCVHPIKERELRLVREFKKMCPSSVYVFTDRTGNPLSETAFRLLLKNLGKALKYPFRVHAHMLRHACGYYLANKGIDTRAIQEYLGHQDINKTVIYTEMAPNRFNNFWNY